MRPKTQGWTERPYMFFTKFQTPCCDGNMGERCHFLAYLIDAFHFALHFWWFVRIIVASLHLSL